MSSPRRIRSECNRLAHALGRHVTPDNLENARRDVEALADAEAARAVRLINEATCNAQHSMRDFSAREEADR